MNKIIRYILRPIIFRWEYLTGKIVSLQNKIGELNQRVFTLERTLDYLIESPVYVNSMENGFNGQKYRKLLFEKICKTFPIDYIIETGTYVGNTTGFLAQKNIPVITIEMNKRFLKLSQKRLKKFKNIDFQLGNSIKILKKLIDTDIINQFTFFYLDAHWFGDLPLQEEIKTIVSYWDRFIIMIDDFKVPGDDGYLYDSYYGTDKTLDLDTFSKLFKKFKFHIFFPSTSSEKETGSKRGCVLLTKTKNIKDTLKENKLLYYYNFDGAV